MAKVIRTIAINDLDSFGLDEHDKLYWRNPDGSYSKLRMTLPGAIQWSAVFIAAGTVVLAAVAVVDSPVCRAICDAIYEAIHHWVT